MTDRLKGVIVFFDQDIRKEDAKALINAIRCIKHVVDVRPIDSQPEDWIEQERAKRELITKLWDVLK